MKILELFSGTESFSAAARLHGHKTFTVDNNPVFKPSLCVDILRWSPEFRFLPGDIDVLWASPPCQAFSVATMGRNWDKHTKEPKSYKAQVSIELIKKTLEIIHLIKPKFFFIENPRAMLRTLPIMKDLRRVTVTYCQYGDKRMKPTDIWTNCDIILKPPCSPGSVCHEPAPRGSRTGTQGLKNAQDRGVIPQQLCEDIIKFCEENYERPCSCIPTSNP